MQHIHRLSDHLYGITGLPCVIEPSRAESAAHLRLLLGAPTLTEHWQGEGTDIQYHADFALTISARLLGGNESLALTHQATALALTLAEVFREPFRLAGELQEPLDNGLFLAPDCLIHGATRRSGEFSRLSEDEESTESRLFVWREDWTASLRTLVTRPYTPPRAQAFTYARPEEPDLHIPGA